MSTLLLIDDDESGLAVRECLVKTVGYKVVSALTGTEGLSLCRECRIDLIILDYNLPDLPGPVIVEQLRAVQPNCPILLLSGVIDVPADVQAKVNATLVKGAGAQKLLDTIRELLGETPCTQTS